MTDLRNGTMGHAVGHWRCARLKAHPTRDSHASACERILEEQCIWSIGVGYEVTIIVLAYVWNGINLTFPGCKDRSDELEIGHGEEATSCK